MKVIFISMIVTMALALLLVKITGGVIVTSYHNGYKAGYSAGYSKGFIDGECKYTKCIPFLIETK